MPATNPPVFDVPQYAPYSACPSRDEERETVKRWSKLCDLTRPKGDTDPALKKTTNHGDATTIARGY